MIDNLNRSQKQKTTKYIKIIGIVAVGLLVVYLLSNRNVTQTNTQAEQSETSDEISGPFATTEINKSFPVPLLDAEGDEIASLKYGIESAELRKEILVKGSKATAIPGRVFLLLNLKLSNESEQGVSVNTRNYIRLSTNENQEEWLAPDIHNDPVEVQAISTKKTRIGFPINEEDTQLVLQFGEISGEKELIELNF